MKTFFLLAIVFAWSVLVNAQPAPKQKEDVPDKTLVGSVTTEKQDVDLSAMDPKVDPCVDFYHYACGGWLAKTPIPEDRAQWARGFSVIDERNKEILKHLLETYSGGKDQPEIKYPKKLGNFYSSCMDESRVEHFSLKTLNEELKKISDVKTVSQLTDILGELHLEGINSLFTDGPEVDLKDPDKMIYFVDQGGLGLPDREYYISKDPKMAEIRREYVKHVTKMLELSGEARHKAKADADKIMQLETSLAQASMDRVTRRDPTAIYHRLEFKGLEEKTPAIDWTAFLKTLGYPGIRDIDVKVPDFFAGLNTILKKTSLDDIKTYLKFHFIDDSAPALPKRFVNERFHFYGHTLAGQQKLQARWKRCVSAADDFLGFALGQAFVAETFGEKGKDTSQDMINSIEKVFGNDLKDLSWMDDQTKKEAFRKLHKVVNKIGYPDKWRNYDSLPIDPKSYLKNRLEGGKFLTRYYMDKIGKPVDRTEWDMTPPTVNAYYDPQFNQMVFPAGILQSPFFGRHAGAPSNYGGIGIVMGHELTHGFDDEGRRYDAEGALKDWWSATSAKEFEKRTSCLVDKYNQYTVQKDLHVNGKLTLGENIADQGGMKLAFEAWKASVSSSKKDQEAKLPSPSTSHFTDAQKYFLSFAQAWCVKTQPQLERMLITVDVHSPGAVRVNGTVSNFKPFADSFQCKEGTPMAPKNRCAIW